MKVCARSARFFKDINLFLEENTVKNALQEAIFYFQAQGIEIMLRSTVRWEIEIMHLRSTVRGKLKSCTVRWEIEIMHLRSIVRGKLKSYT